MDMQQQIMWSVVIALVGYFVAGIVAATVTGTTIDRMVGRLKGGWHTVGAGVIYTTAALTANVLAGTFVSFPWFGQAAVGTFLFGFTFTQRDRVHRAGRPTVYGMIALTALLGAIQSAWFGIPPRIIVASVAAILIAESLDTEVFHRLRRRSWFVRVAGSNAVSTPTDSAVFTLIAFAGVFAPGVLVAIVFGDTVVKWIIGAVSGLIVARSHRTDDETAANMAEDIHSPYAGIAD